MKTTNMQNTHTDRSIIRFEETVSKLPWTPQRAKQSARIALAKAFWLGVEKEVAIQAIYEVAVTASFQANPHILFETWATVSEQLGSPDQFELLAA